MVGRTGKSNMLVSGFERYSLQGLCDKRRPFLEEKIGEKKAAQKIPGTGIKFSPDTFVLWYTKANCFRRTQVKPPKIEKHFAELVSGKKKNLPLH